MATETKMNKPKTAFAAFNVVLLSLGTLTFSFPAQAQPQAQSQTRSQSRFVLLTPSEIEALHEFQTVGGVPWPFGNRRATTQEQVPRGPFSPTAPGRSYQPSDNSDIQREVDQRVREQTPQQNNQGVPRGPSINPRTGSFSN